MRKGLLGPAAALGILLLVTACGPSSMGRWQSIGPAPIRQFAEDCVIQSSPCFNNVTGRVDGMALAPGGVIYLATAGGGVWKSTDGGRSFTSQDAHLPFLSIGAIAVDPSRPNVVYAGTGTDAQVSGIGILRSTDGGRTWVREGARLLTGQDVYALLVTPQAVFAAADEGLYRSTDEGRTWSQVAPGKTTSITDAGGTLYAAAVGRGVERSTDGGASWAVLAGGLPTGRDVGYGAVAAAPSAPSTVYASFGIGRGPHAGALLGVYVSHDGGISWTSAPAPDYSGPDDDLNYATALAVSPTDPATVDAGSYYLVASHDGGRTWTSLENAPPVHVDTHAMAFTSAGDLLVATDGGLFEVPPAPATSLFGMPPPSATKDLWHGLDITQVYALAFLPDGKGLAIGTQDNGFAIDSGGRWRSQFGGDAGQIVVNDASDFVLADDSDIGTLTATPVGGDYTSIAPRRAQIGFLPPLAGVPGTKTLFTGGVDVWRSTNEGQTWAEVAQGARNDGYLTALAVAPSDGRVIYAGWASGVVRMSSDGGRTWHVISAAMPPSGSDSYVTSIAVSPGDPYDIAVALASSFPPLGAYDVPHVFATKDAAKAVPSWTNAGGSLPPSPVNTLLWDGGMLLAGTGQGVYATTDDGRTWHAAGRGLPRVDVLSLALSSDGTVAAGTFGRGVWLLRPQAGGL